MNVFQLGPDIAEEVFGSGREFYLVLFIGLGFGESLGFRVIF